jgi:hypothetical protein
MSGAELALAIVGLVSTGVIPLLASAFSRFRRSRRQYHHRTQREVVARRFLRSWDSLLETVTKVNEILPMLEDHPAKRAHVLQELERAAQVFSETEHKLLGSGVIGGLMKDSERVGLMFNAMEKRPEAMEMLLRDIGVLQTGLTGPLMEFAPWGHSRPYSPAVFEPPRAQPPSNNCREPTGYFRRYRSDVALSHRHPLGSYPATISYDWTTSPGEATWFFEPVQSLRHLVKPQMSTNYVFHGMVYYPSRYCPQSSVHGGAGVCF